MRTDFWFLATTAQQCMPRVGRMSESTRHLLQHTATHCSILLHTTLMEAQSRKDKHVPHTATHCNTLQHTATYHSIPQQWKHVVEKLIYSTWNTLQHTATRRKTLQHTATHRTTLQHTATLEARNREVDPIHKSIHVFSIQPNICQFIVQFLQGQVMIRSTDLIISNNDGPSFHTTMILSH